MFPFKVDLIYWFFFDLFLVWTQKVELFNWWQHLDRIWKTNKILTIKEIFFHKVETRFIHFLSYLPFEDFLLLLLSKCCEYRGHGIAPNFVDSYFTSAFHIPLHPIVYCELCLKSCTNVEEKPGTRAKQRIIFEVSAILQVILRLFPITRSAASSHCGSCDLMTVSNHTRRNIWSHYIFIFFRFAPFGSPFLCSGEGHLQAGARGAHKAGRRAQRFALLQSSYRNELSCLPAAGELRPLSPRILHCFDNEGIQQCSQGEHLRNRLCRIKLGFFIWVKTSARKKQTALDMHY